MKIIKWVVCSLICTVVALVAIGLFGSAALAPQPAGHPVAVAPALGAPATVRPLRPAGGTTLADAAARLELASRFDKSSTRDLVSQVLPDAYYMAQWHKLDPINEQTGEAQVGWFARDLFSAIDYVSDPVNMTYQPNTLILVSRGGVLNAKIITADDVAYDYNGLGNFYVTLNVVFDLPSGRHKYMKMTGFAGERGSLIIDPSDVPELLAQIMTSSYMHIYIPMVGQSASEELLLYNEPFKSLLSPDDRATAQAAMEKADRELAESQGAR